MSTASPAITPERLALAEQRLSEIDAKSGIRKVESLLSQHCKLVDQSSTHFPEMVPEYHGPQVIAVIVDEYHTDLLESESHTYEHDEWGSTLEVEYRIERMNRIGDGWEIIIHVEV